MQDQLEAAQGVAADAEAQLSRSRALVIQRSAEAGAAAGCAAQLEEAHAQLRTYKAKLAATEQEVWCSGRRIHR